MRSNSRGFTLIEFLVVVMLIAIAVALLLPVLVRTNAPAMRVSCASNLSQIAKAMIMYADVPANGRFPCAAKDADNTSALASLGLLYNRYIADPRVFSCPQNPIDGFVLNGMEPGKPVQSSFGYDPGHNPDDVIAAIAADAKGPGPNSDNHGSNAGQNVILGSGAVVFMTAAMRKLPALDGEERLEFSIFKRDPLIDRKDDGFIRQK